MLHMVEKFIACSNCPKVLHRIFSAQEDVLVGAVVN